MVMAMALVAAITVEVETAVPAKTAAAEMVAASPTGAAWTAFAEMTTASPPAPTVTLRESIARARSAKR